MKITGEMRCVRRTVDHEGEALVSGKPRSNGASDRRETGRWLVNRSANSHLPFQILRMFASVHASLTNDFNHEHSLASHNGFKKSRADALG